MVTNSQSILITAPERCGNVSLLALFHGYHRGTIHHIQASGMYPGYSPFFFPGNTAENQGDAVEELWERFPPALVIVLARDPVARVVSDVYHRLDRDELPPIGDMEPSDYVMMMGRPDTALMHLAYDMPQITGVRFWELERQPPCIYDGIWFFRLRDFDTIPVIAQNEGLNVADEVPHMNKSSRPDMQFPTPYVNRLLDNLYTEFWFSEDEIEEMRAKWAR